VSHRPRLSRSVLPVLVPALLVALAVAPTVAAAQGDRPRIVAVRVVGELRQPVAFTFAPDGRIWLVEKAEGTVRVFDPGNGRIEDFFVVPDVVAEAEQGLVGIELDPRFSEGRPFVYLFATRMVEGSLRDQVLRLTDDGGRGTGLRVLWDSPASALHQHSGGRLLFDRDDALLVTVGDARDPATAQDPQSERGTVLRMTRSGAPAPGNPDPDSRVYASGIRNSFGLTVDPFTGTVWATENGPGCNDEVNRIEPGANYGWGPSAVCLDPNDPASTNRDGPDPVAPQLSFTPTIAPTGIAVCDGCGLGRRSEGALFFADFNRGEIHRATLDEAREAIVSEEVVAEARDLALSMEVAPDGSLHFSSYLAIFRLELRGGRPPRTPSPTPAPSAPTPSPPSPPPDDRVASVSDRDAGGTAPVLVIIGIGVVGLLGGLVGGIVLARRRHSGPTGR
jgi:glucose/arabinose dehydrogenase